MSGSAQSKINGTSISSHRIEHALGRWPGESMAHNIRQYETMQEIPKSRQPKE